MYLIIKFIIKALILGLFFHSKLVPHKDKLDGMSKSAFDFFDSIFAPIITFLRKYINPLPVGIGISVDMTQFIILFILLALINF